MSMKLIHNGTLIDGKGGAPIQDGAVLIDDNQIVAVGLEAIWEKLPIASSSPFIG